MSSNVCSSSAEADVVPKLASATKRSIGTRLLTGGAWILAGRLVSAIGGMAVSMLLARVLAPQELGNYFIFASIAVTGAMLAQFGTHQSVVRLVAGGLARGELVEVRRSLRAVFAIALAGSVIVAGGYLGGIGNLVGKYVFKSEAVQAAAGLTAAWLILLHGQILLAQTFRGFHNLGLAALFDGAMTQVLLLTVLVVAWFVAYDWSLRDVVHVTIVAFAVTVIVGILLLRQRYWSCLPAAKGMAIHTTIRLSAPLFVSSTSFVVLGEMHLWILGAVAAPDQVAIYGAGYRLMQLVVLPLGLVNHVIIPTVAELYAQGRKQELERVLRFTATIAALPALIMFVVLTVFAGDVMRLVYGEYFYSGAPVLAILVVGQAINVLTGSPGVLLAMSDHQNLLMRVSLGGGLFGVLVSALLVSKFGAIGVAAGFSISIAIQNIVMVWLCRRYLDVKTYTGRTHLPDLLFWLRGELARRVRCGGFYFALERLLRPLENMICASAKIRIIECFGDSDANIFTRLNRARCCPGVYYRVTLASNADVFDLVSDNFRTNTCHVFSAWLAGVPAKRPVLFILGETGLGCLAGKGVAKASDPPVAMEELLRRYFSFLDAQRLAHGRLILVTVPMPTNSSSQDFGSTMASGQPKAEFSQQVKVTLLNEYNRRLREWAVDNGTFLLDLDAEIRDTETGLLREQYRLELGNQLNPAMVITLLCRLLTADEMQNWLRQDGLNMSGGNK